MPLAPKTTLYPMKTASRPMQIVASTRRMAKNQPPAMRMENIVKVILEGRGERCRPNSDGFPPDLLVDFSSHTPSSEGPAKEPSLTSVGCGAEHLRRNNSYHGGAEYSETLVLLCSPCCPCLCVQMFSEQDPNSLNGSGE